MMITLKMGEVVQMVPSLNRLLDEKLPVKAAYRLSRFIAKFQPELKVFDESRMSLLKEFGTQDADQPETYKIEGSEKQAGFKEKYTLLTEEPVNVDLEPLRLDWLGDVKVTPQDLLALDKIILA